jgi:hypothetical protein
MKAAQPAVLYADLQSRFHLPIKTAASELGVRSDEQPELPLVKCCSSTTQTNLYAPPLSRAACAQICLSRMKKICRSHGIARWPQR